MTNKNNEVLQALRPIIPQAETKKNTSEMESFQNQTLRPIIKFLSRTILSTIKYNLNSFNKAFAKLPHEKKVNTLRTFLEKNQKVKAYLPGMIIGFMADYEIEIYFKTPSEYNKRIMQMIEQRAVDHLNFF